MGTEWVPIHGTRVRLMDVPRPWPPSLQATTAVICIKRLGHGAPAGRAGGAGHVPALSVCALLLVLQLHSNRPQ